MNKGVGFNRNVHLAWLDAAAAFSAETDDPREIRARLAGVVGSDIPSPTNRRKAIDILINIWVKTGDVTPDLRQEAIATFQSTSAPADRLWLHYGLTLLSYPFFRESAAVIGQLTCHQRAVTAAMMKQRLVAAYGQLGSLGKATERVLFSLRNWGILTPSNERNTYLAPRHTLPTSSIDLEAWLLACALCAHPAEELPFTDLVRLPELFPFRFAVTGDQVRRCPRFAVQRQGGGWDSVRLA